MAKKITLTKQEAYALWDAAGQMKDDYHDWCYDTSEKKTHAAKLSDADKKEPFGKPNKIIHTMNNAANWQEQMDADAGREAFREQVEMFQSCKIVSTLTDEGFVWMIYQQDPCFFRWYKWQESDDYYTSYAAAIEAAKEYIDNYEPSQE